MGKSFGDLETIFNEYTQKDELVTDMYMQIKELQKTITELEKQCKSLTKALERRLLKALSDVFMKLANKQIKDVHSYASFWECRVSDYEKFAILFDDEQEAIKLVNSKRFDLEHLEGSKYKIRPLDVGEEVLKEV